MSASGSSVASSNTSSSTRSSWNLLFLRDLFVGGVFGVGSILDGGRFADHIEQRGKGRIRQLGDLRGWQLLNRHRAELVVEWNRAHVDGRDPEHQRFYARVEELRRNLGSRCVLGIRVLHLLDVELDGRVIQRWHVFGGIGPCVEFDGLHQHPLHVERSIDRGELIPQLGNQRLLGGIGRSRAELGLSVDFGLFDGRAHDDALLGLDRSRLRRVCLGQRERGLDRLGGLGRLLPGVRMLDGG